MGERRHDREGNEGGEQRTSTQLMGLRWAWALDLVALVLVAPYIERPGDGGEGDSRENDPGTATEQGEVEGVMAR